MADEFIQYLIVDRDRRMRYGYANSEDVFKFAQVYHSETGKNLHAGYITDVHGAQTHDKPNVRYSTFFWSDRQFERPNVRPIEVGIDTLILSIVPGTFGHRYETAVIKFVNGVPAFMSATDPVYRGVRMRLDKK